MRGDPARQRPTLHDVAAVAGVSVKTASRALNGERYVAASTQTKVDLAAAQLGFRRNTIARELRAGARSNSVGLIIGDVSNPFYSSIARGAERRLQAAGLQLITASSEEDPAREKALLTEMLERRVSGLLVVTSATDHTFLELERRHGTPVVFLDRPPEDIVADTVLLDNEGGVAQAVAHLLAQGHRRIALLGDLGRLSTHQARANAFAQAVTAAGISGWDEYRCTNLHDAETAEAAVRTLQTRRPKPTALLATNNRITVGALRALRDLPDPPALVGFDDFDLADLLGVTVIAHSPELMGSAGADQVITRLAGDTSPAQRQTLPTTLIARGTGERRPRGMNR